MSHPRDLLEREGERFELPQPALDRLVRRRDRKRRRQRVAALVVGLAVAFAAGGALLRAFPADQFIPAVDPSRWSLVPLDPAQTYQTELRAVAFAGGTYVAVGDVSRASQDGSAASPVWTSTDGLRWNPVPVAEAPQIDNLWDVAAGGVGFVSIGYRGDIWYSTDGKAWAEATVPSPTDGHFELYHLVSTGGTVFALGKLGGDAALLRSDDGVQWQMANEAAFGGTDEQSVTDVAAVGSGFVAVGSESSHDRSTYRAVVWTSNDGLTWSRQSDPAGVFADGDPAMTTIVHTSNGIAVQGCAGIQQPWHGVVWTSADGSSWTRAAPQESLDGACIGTAVSVGGVFLATGNTWDGTPDEAGVVWTSADAVTWTRVDTGTTFTPVRHGDVWLNNLLLGPGGLVAVGSIQSVGADQTYQGDAAVWTTMPVATQSAASPPSSSSPSAGDVGATVASGEATVLRAGEALDLDGPDANIEGQQGGIDLHWNGTTLSHPGFYPPGPAFAQAVVPQTSFDALTAQDLAALAWRRTDPGEAPGLNPVSAGEVFAVWTNGGNLAKVDVLEVGNALTLRWITYRWTAPPCENTQQDPPAVDANGDTVLASNDLVVLCGTHDLDLDHGLQEGSKTLAGVDVWWEKVSPPSILNTGGDLGYGGAKLADLGSVDFDSLHAADLRNVSYTLDKLEWYDSPKDTLHERDVVAVRTDDGNYAKMQILSLGYDVAIRFVTYQG